jgi:hypothetical protein
VTETEYFGNLEFRISRELAGMSDPKMRRAWCDGFMPDRKFVATDKGCHIAGQVWMTDSVGSQSLWNFVVLLGPVVVPREEVEWSQVLPAENMTGWLSMDFENKFMKIKPRGAYPDPQVAAT